MEVIRRRIDEMGTSEVSIQRQGADRINVQAPGMSDPEALKARIGKTAKMTFHIVDASVSGQDAAAGRAPPGTIILPQDDANEPFVAVRSRAVLTGDDLTDAQPTFDQQRGTPVVSFKFNQRGARIFCNLTQQNNGSRFATVLDGKVITAPMIHERSAAVRARSTAILPWNRRTSFRFCCAPARCPPRLPLWNSARSAPNSARTRSIPARRRASSAPASSWPSWFWLTAFFGVMACVALVINMAMILACMSMVGATLSLPGIAGLILTIGMAVDANVLVYERMREEQAAGRGPAMAIDAGFHRALVTIIDSHLTQILAALILFQFGHGPVRGFAWTLSIGVITSVFTATLVTQMFIAMWFRAVRPKQLPI